MQSITNKFPKLGVFSLILSSGNFIKLSNFLLASFLISGYSLISIINAL